MGDREKFKIGIGSVVSLHLTEEVDAVVVAIASKRRPWLDDVAWAGIVEIKDSGIKMTVEAATAFWPNILVAVKGRLKPEEFVALWSGFVDKRREGGYDVTKMASLPKIEKEASRPLRPFREASSERSLADCFLWEIGTRLRSNKSQRISRIGQRILYP